MVQAFSSDWLKLLKDPYAVVGVSVSADAQRITKRYRSIAMLLHPDRYAAAADANGELAERLLAKLVNPAYKDIESDQARNETKARLRLQARQNAAPPTSNLAQQLMQLAPNQVDTFYEQAIDTLAKTQYKPLSNFESVTAQIIELNLAYWRLKQGDVFMREKRTGVIPVEATPPKPASLFPHDPNAPTIDYAKRHFERAKEYAKKGLWQEMLRELQDALKIDRLKSEYHSHMGYAYLKLDKPVLAKVSIRTALKLNPQDPVALKFAPQVDLDPATVVSASPAAAQNGVSSNGRSPHSTNSNGHKPAPRPASTPAVKRANSITKPMIIGAVIASSVIVMGFVVWKYGTGNTKPPAPVPVEAKPQSHSLPRLGRSGGWGINA
jgi:curved DNA-binding protein CbpA